MRTAPVLPIREASGHPADLVGTFHQLLTSPPSSSPDYPLLTYMEGSRLIIVTVPMLAFAIAIMLLVWCRDTSLFSYHSLHGG